MDDATRAMHSLMISELPDPGQDLSFQPLHAFPFFSRLPLEIRRMIWRRMLPKGRRIWLSNKLNTKDYRTNTIPTGLSINRESCLETSRYYQMLCVPGHKMPFDCTELHQHDHPICFFDSEADTLVLDEFINDDIPGLPSISFMPKLFHYNAEKLLKVRAIEIQPRHPALSACTIDNDLYLFETLRFLPSLKVISFICPTGIGFPRDDARPHSLASNLFSLYAMIIENLGRVYGHFGLTAPEIVVRDALGNQMQKSTTNH
ncbi:hypothetical protein BKA64DRAFT_648788 [Cadophora sp. MPI-SDFR-AT-0126]|nr:hypothetical protein BKA64DRAFT_648788 [Leotiomycetes sp. MPI-SDFR-AT-0126]